MKKICLTLVGIYLMMLHAFAQYQEDKDTSFYISKPLKIEEINLVSSYYKQRWRSFGNNRRHRHREGN